MSRDLRIFLLAVGLPALLLAAAGIRLVQIEHRHACECPSPRSAAKSGEPVRRSAAPAPAPKAKHNRAGRPPRGDIRGEARGEGRGRDAAHSRKGKKPPHIRRVFSPEAEVSPERFLWIGGCVIGLLFLSLVAGGWLLLRSGRRARADARRKTDFVSNVSHEFKTPLTTICLCAELAQDEGLSPARRSKALSSIVSESNRLKELVLQALDFSRLEKRERVFNCTRTDIVQAIAAAGEPMRERFAAHGLHLPEGAVEAVVDRQAFEQIVVILLDNAAKYAAAAGPVEVTVSSGPKRTEVCVSDRGPGIAAADRSRMFERFWRGDNRTIAETGGAGLGLAIARDLAAGMGARLRALPRDGGGLTMQLELRT